MNLKRIEVIGDDEAEIGEAARRMSENYDFVVTRQDHFSTRSHACVAFATTSNCLLWRKSANFASYSGGIGPTSVWP